MGHELTHGFDDRGKFVTITKPVIRTHSITHLNEDSKIYKGLKYKVNRSPLASLRDFSDCFLVTFSVLVFSVPSKTMIR